MARIRGYADGPGTGQGNTGNAGEGGQGHGSGSNVGSGSAGSSGTSGGNQNTNFSSSFGGTPNKNAAGQTTAFGTTGMPVRPSDQTLQDRMYGTPATGMPSSNVGNLPGSSNAGSTGTKAPVVSQPPKPIPKPIVTIKPPATVTPPAKPVPGTKYPGIGGTTGAGAESEYDPNNWTGAGTAGPSGPGSAMGLPGSTSGLPGSSPTRGITGPPSGSGGTGGVGGGTGGGGGRGYATGGGFGGRGRDGAIVSGNYVEAPGGAQVDPMTGKHGLRHRQQVENQVRRVFGARPDGAAASGGGRPMQGFAGGGASNLPKYGPGSPGGWGSGGGTQSNYEPQYLTGSDASPSSFPRKPNPNYRPPNQYRGPGEGGKGAQNPTGQGQNPGGNPREPGGWA